jgi:hypothetical protein
LELDYNARVNENGFKHLNTLQELIVSDASDMSMDDISTSLTNLTKLVLSESYDLSNGHLEKLTKLKTLTLTYCWGVDWSHLKLQTLSHLEELSLDDHYGDPIYIPSLKKLDIDVSPGRSDDPIVDASKVLRHLTNLEELSWYHNTGVKTWFSIEIFVKLTKLKQITIRKTCYEEMKRLTSSYPMIIVKTFDDDDDSEDSE